MFDYRALSLEFPPLSIFVNIYALRLGSYYFNPTEYRGMNIAHPLCAGYKNRLTGSAVITHDVTTGTGYCLVGFNWIINFV